MSTQPSHNGYEPSEHDIVALRPILENQLEKIVTTFTLHEVIRALANICIKKGHDAYVVNDLRYILWARIGKFLETLATGKAKTFGL
jgi:hypothetical protein